MELAVLVSQLASGLQGSSYVPHPSTGVTEVGDPLSSLSYYSHMVVVRGWVLGFGI